MTTRTLRFLTAAAVLLGAANFSQAALMTFDQAQLLSMVIDNETGLTPIGPTDFHPGPGDYGNGDLVSMTGIAGTNENLAGAGSVYYSLTGAELTAFNDAISAGDTLAITGINDDGNDNWILGLWYEGDQGVVVDGATVASGASKNFSVSLPDVVRAVGVFVINGDEMEGDQFHASWTPVPEPTTMGVWACLFGSGLGLVAWKRRRENK